MLGSRTAVTLAFLLLVLAHTQAEGEDYRPGRRVDVSIETVVLRSEVGLTATVNLKNRKRVRQSYVSFDCVELVLARLR